MLGSGLRGSVRVDLTKPTNQTSNYIKLDATVQPQINIFHKRPLLKVKSTVLKTTIKT